MKKFLIINPFGIGDVLFTTPLIKAIKDNFPDSSIGYWCNERVKDLFKGEPNIDKVFALSRGDLKRYSNSSKFLALRKIIKLLSDIKKEKYEVAFDFSLDHRYGFLSKILGIKKRIGYDYKNRGRFLTDKIVLEGYKSRHIVEYYLELLKFIGIIAKTNYLNLSISGDGKLQAKELLIEAGVRENELLVGIAPGAGASWGKEAYLKHWLAKNFSQLADKIISEFNAKIVILGDSNERQIIQKIIYSMRYNAIDLVGRTNLQQLLGVISSLRLLVTNDGGPLHMAVACGVNTVSMFGPVDELVYGPYPAGPNHIVIKKDLSCRPCYNNFRFSGCEYNRRCIEDITVDDVFLAVRKLI